MMIVSRPILLGVAVFVTLSSALVDHDGKRICYCLDVIVSMRAVVASSEIWDILWDTSLSTSRFFIHLHIGWQFYGGKLRKHKHGLNRATSDVAPKSDNGKIKFDIAPQPEDPDLLMTNDEAPPPAKHSQVAVATSSNSRWKDKEEILLLPDRYSVLSFNTQEYSTETNSFWGRFYVEGKHSVSKIYCAFKRNCPVINTTSFTLSIYHI